MPGMLQLQMVVHLQLAEPQKDALARARAARKRMKLPYTSVQESPTVEVYRDRLALLMEEVGSGLIGIPITREMFCKKGFMDLARIFLTLQAAWREENDKGIELLREGFGHFVERGSIKELKYGGTEETKAQIEVARALINNALPNMGEIYLEAWASDIERGAFWTTDEFHDWLTMGKVCGGSCQAYDGAPYWNKSLGGPVFSLDKLAFTGENGAKMSRALLVPTPVEVAGTTEWDLIVPCVYAADIHRVDFEAIIEGALYAAGLAGCNRVGFPAGMALEGVIGKEIIIEIKDRLGTAIRREKIIPRKIEQESCTIIAVRGPNRYKYWDNAGGMIDYEKASKVNIEGVSVKAVKLPTTALFVGFERIPIDE